MKSYGPYIFVIIAICFFSIPFNSHASILQSQQVTDGYVSGQVIGNHTYYYQGLGNTLTDNIYSLGLYLGTTTFNSYNFLTSVSILTCNGSSATSSSCNSYSPDSVTPTYVNDTSPHLITFNWNTPIVTSGKYVFIQINQGYNSTAVYVYGSTLDTSSYGYCAFVYPLNGNSYLCNDYGWGNIKDIGYIIAGSAPTIITQPPNGSTWYVNPQGFVAYIPGTIASTTLKWNVHFGQISGSYSETSDYGYINQSTITGEYMIPTNFPFAINATSTWYMKPYLYADYNNDGIWTQVYTGNETSFTIAPASIVYSGGYSGLDGQMHYYNLNTSVTGLPATTTAACSDTNGISYYFCIALTWAFVPPDCVISSTGQTSCTSFTRFSTVLDAYSEKAPWGYYGRFKQLVNDMASSTTATSTFSGLTDWLPTEGPLYTFIEYFKAGTAVLIWFTSVAFTLKIATLFL